MFELTWTLNNICDCFGDNSLPVATAQRWTAAGKHRWNQRNQKHSTALRTRSCLQVLFGILTSQVATAVTLITSSQTGACYRVIKGKLRAGENQWNIYEICHGWCAFKAQTNKTIFTSKIWCFFKSVRSVGRLRYRMRRGVIRKQTGFACIKAQHCLKTNRMRTPGFLRWTSELRLSACHTQQTLLIPVSRYSTNVATGLQIAANPDATNKNTTCTARATSVVLSGTRDVCLWGSAWEWSLLWSRLNNGCSSPSSANLWQEQVRQRLGVSSFVNRVFTVRKRRSSFHLLSLCLSWIQPDAGKVAPPQTPTHPRKAQKGDDRRFHCVKDENVVKTRNLSAKQYSNKIYNHKNGHSEKKSETEFSCMIY